MVCLKIDFSLYLDNFNTKIHAKKVPTLVIN